MRAAEVEGDGGEVRRRHWARHKRDRGERGKGGGEGGGGGVGGEEEEEDDGWLGLCRGHLDVVWTHTALGAASLDPANRVAKQDRADFVAAAKHARAAVQKADAAHDDFNGAVARWELGAAIIFGGEGARFTKGRVASLYLGAKACLDRLKMWGYHKQVASSCAGDQFVTQFVEMHAAGKRDSHTFPAQVPASPPSAESSAPAGGGMSIGSLAFPDQCGRCALHYPSCALCSGCGLHQYCGRGCQRADWKDHKTGCKKAQAAKKAAKGGDGKG